jgi:hypothetical protein
MAQVKVFYEPERELLTIFWQEPRRAQVCTELDDGVVLIKDEATGEPIVRRKCPAAIRTRDPRIRNRSPALLSGHVR